jgi:hypothetical protein
LRRRCVAQLFSNLLGNALTAALIIDNSNALGTQGDKQILDIFRLAMARACRIRLLKTLCRSWSRLTLREQKKNISSSSKRYLPIEA